jgi:3-deoxy-D-manno-octulosonate 8-phosphate phosphatase (KDO 8-P phosphatase)
MFNASIFESIAGKFISNPKLIQDKLSHIKAFVFDWDGVFNNGQKEANGSSNFSEVDSMGTNLLRYSYYLKNKSMPISAIISGEKNETAFFFSKREFFDYSFFKIPNKTEALNYICEKNKIKPHQIAYFFDDILDLSIAKVCGVRILIHRKSNPLFTNYCIKNNLVDYITGSEGGHYAIREATELLMALNENFDEAITDRLEYNKSYTAYITERRKMQTQFFTIKENLINKVEI